MMAFSAPNTGKALVKIAAVKIFKDHIKDIRPPIAIMLLVTLVPDSLKLFEICLHTLEVLTLPRIICTPFSASQVGSGKYPVSCPYSKTLPPSLIR